MGIATLDGLGVQGAGAHTLDEHIVVDSLAYRGKLMAGLLATLDVSMALRWCWRVIHGRPRLFIGLLCGLAVAPLLPGEMSRTTRSILAWDIGVIVYLVRPPSCSPPSGSAACRQTLRRRRKASGRSSGSPWPR